MLPDMQSEGVSMTAAEIADRLWAKYAADLPAEKRAHAAMLLDEMKRDLTWWPGFAWYIIEDTKTALKAWRETEDVQG